MDSIALNVAVDPELVDALIAAMVATAAANADEMDAPDWDSGAVTFDPYL